MPLGDASRFTYERRLTRAFGALSPAEWFITPKVQGWPESSKAILRAAIRWKGAAVGLTTDRINGLLSELPVVAPISRAERAARVLVHVPDEQQALAYEAAARQLPKGIRVVALLPLTLGLRAAEVCALTRQSVENALSTGKLNFRRKGAKVQTFEVVQYRALFEELLACPGRQPRAQLNIGKRGPNPYTPGQRIKRVRWQKVGDILSAAGPQAQYQCLHTLVQNTAKAAGLKLRPHLLRHAFASRMNRDGASMFTIQAALNHKDVSTTALYVHPDAHDVARFMRPDPLAPPTEQG